MLNIVELSSFNKDENDKYIIPQLVLDKISEIKRNVIDHVLFRGFPVSENLPNTPIRIQDSENHPAIEGHIFSKIVSELGEISDKKIENTIRFITKGKTMNEEPWHNHSQHKYSILYCLYSDMKSYSFLESANQIMRKADRKSRKNLLSVSKYVCNVEEFSLIKEKNGIYEFSRDIFGHSYLENEVDNLDLPDALKKLKKMIKSVSGDTKKSVQYLIEELENSENKFIYQVGDLAIVNEASTIRFSPAYFSSTKKGREKWLLAASVKNY